MFVVNECEIEQRYGAPEEGRWRFDAGVPVWRPSIRIPSLEELGYKIAGWLNWRDGKRAEREEEYGYPSVLSHRSQHYAVEDFARSGTSPGEGPRYGR